MTKIQKLIKSVERTNKAFAKMNRAEQRVQIAKDVIAALKVKQLTPKHQSYFDVSENTFLRMEANGSDSLKDTLKTIPTCHVCAKGAIFTCTVARKNKVTNRQLLNQDWRRSDSLSKSLQGTFSARQLRLIETEFEDDDIDYGIGDTRPISPVMELHELFDNAEDRMIAIMKNIIANKGTFKPKAPKDKSK